MKRVFLLGFMGVGKSTLGRIAAAKLSTRFMDFDVLVEQYQEMTISQIFSQCGQAFFRKIEHDLLREVVQTETDFIMGTGGGLPCFHSNLEFMNEHGVTVYLKAPSSAIVERLWNSSGARPLIANKSREELSAYVEETLRVRSRYYEQAKEILELDLTSSKVLNAGHLVQIIKRLEQG